MAPSGEASSSRMGDHRLPDELLELIAKYLAIELARVCSDLVRVPRTGFGSPNRANQALYLLLFEQHARPTLDDRVQYSSTGVRNDRPTARIRLEWRNSEIFFARKNQRATARVQL